MSDLDRIATALERIAPYFEHLLARDQAWEKRQAEEAARVAQEAHIRSEVEDIAAPDPLVEMTNLVSQVYRKMLGGE